MRLNVSLRFSPEASLCVGTLSDCGRDTAFEFAPEFIGRGLSPAPFRLPVKAGVSVYDRQGGLETFGLFEDSLPDGWGRRLVDVRFRKRLGRLPTVLERLACVGSGGRGALVYEPTDEETVEERSIDLSALANAAMDFDAGRAADVLPALRRLGGSSGGARPKAFIGFNPKTGEVCAEREVLPDGFEHWMVKFNTRAEGDRAGLDEFRHYELARRAGADMAPSRLIETSAGRFFATRRFDRVGNRRFHMASAAGLLHADFRTPGDEYQILFRLTDALTRDDAAKRELFRRAALNVLAHNRDDHLKNFAYLMDASGRWTLAPFYDFTRSEGPNGWQTLSVAGEGANPGRADLLRLADQAALDGSVAREIVDQVEAAVADAHNLLS